MISPTVMEKRRRSDLPPEQLIDLFREKLGYPAPDALLYSRPGGAFHGQNLEPDQLLGVVTGTRIEFTYVKPDKTFGPVIRIDIDRDQFGGSVLTCTVRRRTSESIIWITMLVALVIGVLYTWSCTNFSELRVAPGISWANAWYYAFVPIIYFLWWHIVQPEKHRTMRLLNNVLPEDNRLAKTGDDDRGFRKR